MSTFNALMRKITAALGHPIAVISSISSIVIWAFLGPLFSFSDTWQLWANTGTTIITFVMVFVIQASQNADTQALHAKIDELIRALPDADDHLRHLEDHPDLLASLKAQAKNPTAAPD